MLIVTITVVVLLWLSTWSCCPAGPVYKSTCIPAAADGSQRAPIYITNGNAGEQPAHAQHHQDRILEKGCHHAVVWLLPCQACNMGS